MIQAELSETPSTIALDHLGEQLVRYSAALAAIVGLKGSANDRALKAQGIAYDALHRRADTASRTRCR